jgi:hypothetical protein
MVEPRMNTNEREIEGIADRGSWIVDRICTYLFFLLPNFSLSVFQPFSFSAFQFFSFYHTPLSP